MDIEDYNIILLRQELSGCKTVDEGRTLLKGKIFEWSDDYSENLMESESVDKHTAFDAIVKLWLEWANYEYLRILINLIQNYNTNHLYFYHMIRVKI